MGRQASEVFASVEHTFDNGWTGRIGIKHLEDAFDTRRLFTFGARGTR
jgi:outer membrane receptor for ferric coprogen and ferric-rhodotorulic acid